MLLINSCSLADVESDNEKGISLAHHIWGVDNLCTQAYDICTIAFSTFDSF